MVRHLLHPFSGLQIFTLLLLGAPACTVYDEPLADCSLEGQKEYVQVLMNEHYLWYEQSPEVDRAEFATPQELLAALRYDEVDRWSGMEPVQVRVARYEEGRFIGLGFQMVAETDRPEVVRIGLVYADSPAGDAGVERGMRIVSINGTSIEAIVAANVWGDAFGPAELGVPVDLTLEQADGTLLPLALTNDWVQMETVHTTRVHDTSQGPAGYLLFTSFLGISVGELRDAFADFQTDEITELVLDLRYNGGGLVATAQLLASLVAGPEWADEPFVKTAYNDRHQDWNHELPLTDEPEALGLERLLVIAGPATASASELVINGLKPFVDVVLIGAQTYGKPVGSDPWYFCGQVISPITFRSLNALGEGDYFGGLPVDCQAEDDLDHALGDPAEARLQSALHWIETGGCPEDVTRPDVRQIKGAASELRTGRTPTVLVTRGPADPFGWF